MCCANGLGVRTRSSSVKKGNKHSPENDGQIEDDDDGERDEDADVLLGMEL